MNVGTFGSIQTNTGGRGMYEAGQEARRQILDWGARKFIDDAKKANQTLDVKGDDMDPLYKFLTSKESDPDFAGDITWNFNKFLVDRNGKVVARFSSKDTPESENVTAAIEKYLAAK